MGWANYVHGGRFHLFEKKPIDYMEITSMLAFLSGIVTWEAEWGLVYTWRWWLFFSVHVRKSPEQGLLCGQ